MTRRFWLCSATTSRISGIAGRCRSPRWGQDATIVAAELEFPDSSWNLAIAFSPARKVQIDGLKVQFVIPIRQPETWSMGFCKPGSLDEWRGAGKRGR